MTDTITIHVIAVDWYRRERGWRLDEIDRWPSRHPHCPAWLARRIMADMRRAAPRRARREAVRHAMTVYGERSTAHLSRDYRGWHRDGRREGPGSGRAADWLDVGFRDLSALAQAIYRETGYRDAECRRIARTLHSLRGGWESRQSEDARIAALPPCPVEPIYWDRGSSEQHDRAMAGADPHVARWRLWRAWHGERAIAARRLAELLARLAADPAATISGYLAASIQSYRRGEPGYEGCAGCSHYALIRERPDTWDYLMSRAPRGPRGEDWAVVYPHEDATPYREAGWYCTMTLSYDIWSRRHPLETR